MLSPAMMLGIYFLVFSVFLKNGLPHFAIYLFSGLVVWNMYMNAVTGATGVIVQRGSLVKKVSFPREVLPLSYVGASVVYFAIQLVVLFIFVFAFGHAPQWSWMWLLPISFASLLFFTAAVGVVMSGVNVYMRDMGHLIEVLLQLWFWGTPICYSYENSIAPHLAAHGLSSLYFFNPITPIVLTFQRVFYNSVTVTSTTTHQILHVLPSWSLASYFYLNVLFLALSIFLFLIAESLFGRLELNFESEL
jgi:ABC-2 type transport system permease protein